MRLGLSFVGAAPNEFTRAQMIGDATMAENLGFESLWFFDALGRGPMHPDPLIALSVAAGVTQNIEVGTCIMQLPLRRAAELAQRVLTAQLVCDGRFSFGVGAGSTKTDFDLMGLDFKSRMQATQDCLDTMRALWKGEAINGVSLSPPEDALGGPPILIGSWSGARWIEQAATQFDGWIASGARSSVKALSDGIAAFREHGGSRAIVTNIRCDMTIQGEPLDDDTPFNLNCPPAEAKERLEWIARLGYDDAVLMVPNRDEAQLRALRALID
jgi:alkanesulfonate monooxygenase SsuD/methylene tetrahydromethanopterin reductase-like flavin-dependent oxidoreductase (luciferase family)